MIPYRKIFAGLAVLGFLTGAAAQERVFIPSFADPQQRPPKPDPATLGAIRFVTEDDYPPFHFALGDGQLAGFNIDIARAVCEELQVACTVQRRQWDLLAPALADKSADAIVASLAITPQARQNFDFSLPYYATPARFVTPKTSTLADATPETLAGKTIGVVAGSAHAAYLERFFAQAKRQSFDDAPALRAALKAGTLDAVFGDGVGLAIWLNSADAAACCQFRGGPYTESLYFGEGVGIAVRKGDNALRRALDYALSRLYQRGLYGDLYLKWFPVGFY
jgi:polar amino acid transport system substrate-binding protein